jgi:hypothetical protein
MAETARCRAVAFHLGGRETWETPFLEVWCVLSLMAGRYAISNERSEASLGANTKGESRVHGTYLPRIGHSIRRAGKDQGAGTVYCRAPTSTPLSCLEHQPVKEMMDTLPLAEFCHL